MARKLLGLLSPRAVDPVRVLTSFEFSFSMDFSATATEDSETVSAAGVFVRPSRQDCALGLGNTESRVRLVVIGERAWASRGGHDGPLEEVHDEGSRWWRSMCASDPAFWALTQELGAFALPRHMEGVADTIAGINTRRFDLAETDASRLKQRLVRGPKGAEVRTHCVWLAEWDGWIAAFDIELEAQEPPTLFPNRGAVTPYGPGTLRASLRLSRANDTDLTVETPASSPQGG